MCRSASSSIFKQPVPHTAPHLPRRHAPGVLLTFRALKSEGAGKAGCALHPRSRVQNGKRNAHEHTGSAEAIRPSLRNGFTAYFALSPVTGFVATVAARMSACRAVRADIAFQRNLTPASGCQDHTTSPSASRAVRQRRIRVHRIPSRVCDDRERPSDGTRRAKDAGDLGLRQSGIFFRAGLDRWNQLEAAREIRLPRLCRLASFTLRRCR